METVFVSVGTKPSGSESAMRIAFISLVSVRELVTAPAATDFILAFTTVPVSSIVSEPAQARGTERRTPRKAMMRNNPIVLIFDVSVKLIPSLIQSFLIMTAKPDWFSIRTDYHKPSFFSTHKHWQVRPPKVPAMMICYSSGG